VTSDVDLFADRGCDGMRGVAARLRQMPNLHFARFYRYDFQKGQLAVFLPMISESGMQLLLIALGTAIILRALPSLTDVYLAKPPMTPM
jgi:hypothetical protein